ncbi:30S ribosomal protein S24e [Candidatus Micrarchaeota archaeon]|nr:30S ribosomal protein S24e [Candidatus Micrarchaeota archaeon]
METVEQKENPLQGRKELILVMESEKTPSRKELVDELCKKFGVSQEQVILNKVDHPFGSRRITVRAKIYSSLEQAKRFEPGYRFERGMKKKGTKPT